MLVVLLAGLAFRASMLAPTLCTPGELPPIRRAAHVAMIAVATGDTAFVADSSKGGSWAQVVLALEVRLDSSMANYDQPAQPIEMLLIPWDYGMGCERVAWRASALFLRPGTRGLIIGELRGSVKTLSARWAADVPFAALQPYRVRELTGLTDSMYLELFAVMPTLEEIIRSPKLARDALEELLRARPEWARQQAFRGEIDRMALTIDLIAARSP